MKDERRVAAVVFDAYGTLLDLGAPTVRVLGEGPLARRIGAAWRAYQLEFAWTESALGLAPDFWSVTARALDHVVAETLRTERLPGDPAVVRDQLLEAYRRAEAFADAHAALGSLREAGIGVHVYSNAGRAMLEDALASCGLLDRLDSVLSVEIAGHFKPRPEAYSALVERLGRSAAEIGFVSSNSWDVAGATKAGLSTAWVDRTRAAYPYDSARPVVVVDGLASAAAWFVGDGRR